MRRLLDSLEQFAVDVILERRAGKRADLPMDSATEQADAPDNEDDNQGLGINAFFNKQKGGKKMRKKITKIMGDQKTKLNSDLQNVKK